MTTVTPSRPLMPSRVPGPRPSAPKAGGVASTIDPFRVLRRHLMAIITSGVIGTILGVVSFLVLQRTYPLYKGQYLLEVRAGLDEATGIGSADLGNDDLAFRLANTETALLTSRDVLKAACSEPETQNTQWFQQNFMNGTTPMVEDAVDDLEEDISSTIVRRSNLFGLTWSTHRADDVPVVLNNIARAYLAKRKDIDNALFGDSLAAFTGQLSQSNRDLEDLNHQIKAFIREKGITTLEDVKYSQKALQMQMLTGRITDANATLNQLRTAYMQTAQKLEGTVEPTSEDRMQAEVDGQVVGHSAAILNIKTELRVLREKYPFGHQRLDELASRLGAVEQERDNKMDEIIQRNLSARLKAMGNQLEQYQELLTELEDTAETEDKLLRDLTADQAEYESMEKRREFLEVARDTDLGLIKEVQLMRLRQDAARVRTAQMVLTPRELSFPLPEIIIPLGALLGVGLTIGVIFLREVTDNRVKSASDLSVIPGAEVLGVVPELEEDPTNVEIAELVVRKHPNSVLAESNRQACAAIFKAMERTGHQTMVLVGGLPGAGTTTFATNVAAAYAGAGKKIVIVDANFRRPKLADAMDLPGDGPGLGDLLSNEASLEQVILDAGGGISVIPVGTPANRIVERLHTVQFDTLLAELRARYELVLFDAPPAVVSGESMILANKVDAAVVVVRAYQEQRGLVARMINQLSDARCDLLGILLNRPRGTAGGYFKKNYATMAEYSSQSAA